VTELGALELLNPTELPRSWELPAMIVLVPETSAELAPAMLKLVELLG